MDSITVLRDLMQGAHEFLEGTMADVTTAQAHWLPAGKVSTIGTNYLHVLASEDMTIQGMFQGGAPLYASTWAGKIGASEPPPFGPGHDNRSWGEHARLDLDAARQYAQAVYAATNAYLASLKPDDLERPFDLSQFGLGQQPMLFLLRALIANASMHCGEISCLKGLQGAKGYPL